GGRRSLNRMHGYSTWRSLARGLDRRQQRLRLIRAEREMLAVLHPDRHSVKPGNVVKPAETAEVDAPAFKHVGAHGFRKQNQIERYALANPARTKSPAQFAIGDFDCERVE